MYVFRNKWLFKVTLSYLQNPRPTVCSTTGYSCDFKHSLNYASVFHPYITKHKVKKGMYINYWVLFKITLLYIISYTSGNICKYQWSSPSVFRLTSGCNLYAREMTHYCPGILVALRSESNNMMKIVFKNWELWQRHFGFKLEFDVTASAVLRCPSIKPL